ncbi:MAG: hypothetical protein MJ192_11235 [Clostridia bacterium]|nr:hypothetical protein [Clostridia bacterium]
MNYRSSGITRKLLCLLLAVLLTAGLLTGCAGREERVTVPVTVEGAVFAGQAGDRVAADLTFDPAWLTDGKPEKYNADLASFAALLCADSYYREKDLAKGTQNRVLIDSLSADEYTPTVLLETLGFEDVVHIESFKAKEYTADGNDSVTLTLAHRNVGDKYNAYVVVIRGCFSAQEWISTFDPGCGGGAYEALTGAHPEWTEPSVCKGFAIAAARAEEFIDEYVAAHGDPGLKDCMLITGHSRGGAIANLIGAGMELENGVRCRTYTFNAPGVVDEDAIRPCSTVFNVFDVNDFYTATLPFSGEKLARYGIDMTLNLEVSAEARAALTALKQRDDYTGASEELRNAYADLFGRRFNDRASLYELHTVTETFSSREEAEARLTEMQTLSSGLNLGSLYVVGELTEQGDGSFTCQASCCDAALLVGYAMVLAYGQAAHDGFISLFAQDADGCALADLLNDHIAELSAGHLLINSYVLTQYVK